MRTTNPPSRRLLAVASACALTLSVAACSSSGGNKASSTTTAAPSTTQKAETTTSEATTTTEASVSKSDLEALLPTVSDLPDGYKEVPTSDDGGSDSETDKDIEKACPDGKMLNEVLNDGDKKADSAKAAFVGAGEQSIDVEVRAASGKDVDVDAVISALNACKTIDTTLGTTPAKMAISAERSDIGAQGIKMNIAVSAEEQGVKFDLTLAMIMFRRNGIAAQVTAGTGISSQTGELTDPDIDVAEQLAKQLDQAIKDR